MIQHHRGLVAQLVEDRRLFVGACEAERVVGVASQSEGVGHQRTRSLGLTEVPRRQGSPCETAHAGVVAVSGLKLQVQSGVVELPTRFGVVHRPIEAALVEHGARKQVIRAHVVGVVVDGFEIEHLLHDLCGAPVLPAALVQAGEAVEDGRQRPSGVGRVSGKLVGALVRGLDLG